MRRPHDAACDSSMQARRLLISLIQRYLADPGHVLAWSD
jgi:hypothetical protein